VKEIDALSSAVMDLQSLMQQVPGMPKPGEKMTQAQREQLLAQMPPELREQAKAIEAAMADFGTICKAIGPPKDDPDRPISLLELVIAYAMAPSYNALGDHIVPETLDAMERVLVEHEAFALSDLVVPAALAEEQAAEAAGDASPKDLPPPPAAEDAAAKLSTLSVTETAPPAAPALDAAKRRNVLLIYWVMYMDKMGEDAPKLDPRTNVQVGLVKSITTKLLIRCQTVLPMQCKLIQQSLAVANMSALFSNQLWSNDDPECKKRMVAILDETGGRMPEISLEGRCTAAETGASTVMPGKKVQLDVTMLRNHAHGAGEEIPECPNPQGIYEAWWCFVEGLKPHGTPNSLISAQPVVVKDLTQAMVETQVLFIAPGAGKYQLRVHFCSTSIVGCYASVDVPFVVEDDDVPCLE